MICLKTAFICDYHSKDILKGRIGILFKAEVDVQMPWFEYVEGILNAMRDGSREDFCWALTSVRRG